MASLNQARVALAAQIAAKAVPALTAQAFPMDQVNPPVALILPARTNVAKYGITLGEGLVTDAGIPFAPAEFNLDVLVVVAHASTTERVQETLDAWLGFENGIDPATGTNTVSVAAAIAADPTLGGTVDYCEANAVISYGPVEISGVAYFGARVSVTVSTQ